MRKALIAVLLLVALAVGGVCSAATDIYSQRDQVLLTETTVFGDRAEAEGLAMQVHAQYGSHLYWDTTYLHTDGEPVVDTVFSYYSVARRLDRSVASDPINLYSSVNHSLRSMRESPVDEHTPLSALYQKMLDYALPGQEVSQTINLKDYFEFYPLSGNLSIPGTGVAWDASTDWEAIDFEPGSEFYAAQKLMNYFRIPVLESERLHVHIKKNQNGTPSGWGYGSADGDHFNMTTISTRTDSACYFTFDPHSYLGVSMDLSYLPDGYGIYCLPYQANGRVDQQTGLSVSYVDADALSVVYPLDPDIEPLALHLNPDQTRLLLHAHEGDHYVLTVIDLTTMKTLQKLTVAPWTGNTPYWTLHDQEDFLVVEFHGDLIVISPDEDGVYQVNIHCPLEPQPLESLTTTPEAVWAFDGERLAVFSQLWNNNYALRENSCNSCLAIYRDTGLVYCGEYRSSLVTGSESACSDRSVNPRALRWTIDF